MNNLASKWKEVASDKYGTIIAGIKVMNRICNKRHTGSCINEMIAGKRNVSPKVQAFMTNDVLPILLKEAKIVTSEEQYEILLYGLLLPTRQISLLDED